MVSYILMDTSCSCSDGFFVYSDGHIVFICSDGFFIYSDGHIKFML